ncbi:MAG: hypoxanthine-guanine phosphoribosyltransferase [Gammaproteobacteria bacterium]
MINEIREIEKNSKELFSSEEVKNAIDKMANKINDQLSESNPILLCTVIGGIVLTGLLLPKLNFPLELDYIHASRYKGETKGGHLHWLKQPEIDLKNRTVLVVDDILDQGHTLEAIIDFCRAEGAAQILTAVLVAKDLPERGGLKKADFTGLVAANEFLVGYGMDYKGYLRNLDSISAIYPD